MDYMGLISLVLILANFACSYKGFNDTAFLNKYKFQVDKILIYKDYKRLLTSGFLHVNWMHLIFNMLSLYFFSEMIEYSLGWLNFLIIYFSSLLGGNLLSLFINRNHNDYSSVGASGAVSGIIFASIALFPGMGIGFFLLPVSIPAWIYGLLYISYSIYGIKSKKDNIGHESHLGGALIGMMVALVLVPTAFLNNYPTILLIALPTIAFIVLITVKPQALLVDNLYFKTHQKFYNIDHRYNEEKKNQQKELDRILDKISRKGMESLSQKDKDKLNEYSRMVR